TISYVMNRFGHSGFREDCELLVEIVRALGEEAVNQLVDVLSSSPATEAAESIGLLSQLAPQQISRILPVRLAQWPRSAHDRTIRQLSCGAAGQGGSLVIVLYDSLDMLIRPLSMDEMGMSGSHECIPKLIEIATSEANSGYIRLKAVEALGRLKATAATG